MPYSLAFDDHFYCQTDGRLECGHVFLSGNGLPQRWLERESIFRIGELGFGTGLNLCETWRQWKEVRNGHSKLHFMSFELYPMKADEIDRALSRWPEVDTERKALVARWPADPKGEVDIELDDQTRLTVVCGEALTGISGRSEGFDAWFLDGFAPARNPDMWSLEIMQTLFGKTVPGAHSPPMPPLASSAATSSPPVLNWSAAKGLPESVRCCAAPSHPTETAPTAATGLHCQAVGTSRRGIASPSHCAILSSRISGLMGFDR